jgi:hypothetical protein
MADRKQFLSEFIADSELVALMEASRAVPVSEEELREQRISFAYGNALESDDITKDSVRETSMHIRLQA